jgi:hypothetical protein
MTVLPEVLTYSAEDLPVAGYAAPQVWGVNFLKGKRIRIAEPER